MSSPSSPNPSQPKGYEPKGLAEFHKLWSDYLKHITTLSTGSILLIATFLEKLFSHPRWKPVMIAALLGFLVAILGSTLALSALTIKTKHLLWPSLEENEGETGAWVAGALISWVGFCVGIVALTAFTIRNLT